jgi:hypothetical protein
MASLVPLARNQQGDGLAGLHLDGYAISSILGGHTGWSSRLHPTSPSV